MRTSQDKLLGMADSMQRFKALFSAVYAVDTT